MSYTPTEWESTDVVTATRMNALEQAVGDMNMSYTPNTWSDGDILSAEKMNTLEQAVASGGAGGGSSDLFLATVTLEGTAPQGYTVDWWSIHAVSTPQFGGERESRYVMNENYSETSSVFQVIVYEGTAYIDSVSYYDTTNEVGFILTDYVLSDNVTYDSENGRFVITGDCTIGGTLIADV